MATIEAIRQRIEQIEELPSLPTIVAEINELLNNPQASAKGLAKIIMRDPAITAKVLKIANSAFFGFQQKITSVNQAIVALGFNTVRSIVLCTSVIEAFSSASKGREVAFNRKEFWTFSVAAGAGARVVARNAKYPKRENAFVAGLLHGVGKIVLDDYFHEEFGKTIAYAEEKRLSWWEAQRDVMGVTDAEVSGALLQVWKLGDELINPVMYQEEPEKAPEEYRQLAAFTLIGNVLARLTWMGNPGDVPVPGIDELVMEIAGVTPEQWTRLLELTIDEGRKASVFFEM